MGATTTQDQSAARDNAADRVAFHSGDGVGVLIANFRSSIPSPSAPHVYASPDTSQRPVQNSGPSGSLLPPRKALSSSIPCRFIPAHHRIFFPPRLQFVA